MPSIQKEDFNDNQLKILQLLMEQSYIQKDLQTALGISSPGLLYHLNKLEDMQLIQKETIQQIGNAKINEIRIEPLQYQNIRRIFDLKINKCTLITGFGELGSGYRIPDEAFSLLHNKIFQIDQIVCITTKLGKKIRQDKEKTENLMEVAQYHANYEYNDFRNINSQFFHDIDNILRQHLKDSNLVIDITPLSKLYSFEMLKRANQYQLACYYIGKNEKAENSLIWMTDVELTGGYT